MRQNPLTAKIKYGTMNNVLKICFVKERVMKKVIVIGCPGSGKSTFSRELQRKTKIPLYHLDMMYWNADKTTVEKRTFLERLDAVINTDGWIIDGNYASTMELRMEACDTVFFLDYPADVCLDGVRERMGKPRSDMPWIENTDDEEFIAYIKSFNESQRPQIFEMLEKYKDKSIVVFHSREEADEFLRKEYI
jgi:adenylate kinase family enzyme